MRKPEEMPVGDTGAVQFVPWPVGGWPSCTIALPAFEWLSTKPSRLTLTGPVGGAACT